MRRLEIDDPAWVAFVSGHDGAGPFHHPAWAALVAATYGFEPFALAIEQDGRVVAGLPVIEVRGATGRRRWASLPFTDELTPLLSSGVSMARLATELDAVRRAADIATAEVRSALPVGTATPCGEAVIHKLRLDPDPQKVFKTFHRSQVQRNIERAQREGVTVRRATSVHDLDAIFYGLHLSTRHRQGVPIQPKRYFRAVWRHMFERGLGFALVASAGDVPVSAAVFLTWKKTIIYKYAASDAAYWRVRPNHLLCWTAIDWACRNGYEVFDWGRSDLENQGLREYKSNWGSAEEPLVYSCLGDAPTSAGKGRALDLLERIIKRSPPWVCRAFGELLYRYAA